MSNTRFAMAEAAHPARLQRYGGSLATISEVVAVAGCQEQRMATNLATIWVSNEQVIPRRVLFGPALLLRRWTVSFQLFHVVQGRYNTGKDPESKVEMIRACHNLE